MSASPDDAAYGSDAVFTISHAFLKNKQRLRPETKISP